jgi:hypothetical protein
MVLGVSFWIVVETVGLVIAVALYLHHLGFF